MKNTPFNLIVILFTTVLLFSILSICEAQTTKRFAVSFSVGGAQRPIYFRHYDKVHIGSFYTLSADYAFAQRHSISLSINAGKNNYFTSYAEKYATTFLPIAIPASVLDEYNSSIISYTGLSLLYKYRVLNTNKISIFTGIGFHTIREVVHPLGITAYYGATPSYVIRTDRSIDNAIMLALRLEMQYKLNDKWAVGILGGAFINPSNEIDNYHFAPSIIYKF